jgi:hypothetical protein
MAITKCSLIQRTGKEELTGGKRIRTYQAVYKLKSNTRNEDPATVLAYAGLPTLFPVSTWPTDATAYLVARTPSQNQALADEWTVTCDYTSNPSTRDNPDEYVENPLLRPAEVSKSSQQRQRILIRDVEGNFAINSAGEFLNPPPEHEVHPPSFTITKNLVVWPHALEAALQDSVNSLAISIPYWGIVYGALLGKFNGFSGSPQFENGFRFWRVTAEIETDWDGWNKPLIDAGFNEIFYNSVSGQDELWPIIGANGERPAEPVLLNGSGEAAPYGTPVEIPFKKYREVNHLPLYQLMGLIP